MHVTSRRRRLARWGWFGWLIVLGSGCASTTAPPGWLQTAREPSNGRGGWIALALRSPSDDRASHVARARPRAPWDLEGELIAVSPDSISVLVDSTLHGVAWLQVQRAELTGYDSQASELAAWTVLGTLSTASHGVGLILTAPFWVISGAASTAKQSRCGYVRYPPAIREDFLPYARFPQGLPPEVDRSRLGGGPVRAVPRQPRARDSMPGS